MTTTIRVGVGLLLGAAVLAQAHTLEPLPAGVSAGQVLVPHGVYAHIDTRQTQEMLQVLTQGTAVQQQAALDRVRAAPERFQPPVLYAMSQVLFKAKLYNEAAFWFYAGQLRARFDANRCTDPTTRQAVDALNQTYGAPVNRYLFQDLDRAEDLISNVVAWDRKTPYDYDPHWINLHGMQAVQAARDPQSAGARTAASLSQPPSEWAAIAERTRVKYLKSFQDAITGMQHKLPPSPPAQPSR
ncbi:hypothetical protein N7321_03960 [Comamonas aquatica]|nr:hypothetical protein [Comamonas aquatica]MDH0381136.1 hypothetical protein [Comamonas aquatica]MDH0428923.1 hypothetical protein [Comamonas aquatica]MDH0939339.1 hypothetical protein [Comamonas aquatica]